MFLRGRTISTRSGPSLPAAPALIARLNTSAFVGCLIVQILDIPDGHRAPVPVQRCSSGSQSEPSPGPLDAFLLSPSQSPCPLDPSLLSPPSSPCPIKVACFTPSQSPCPMGQPGETTQHSCADSSSGFLTSTCVAFFSSPELAECEVSRLSPSLPPFPPEPSLFQPCSSSPRPNKTCSFLREPPEGCERVRVCEEAP